MKKLIVVEGKTDIAFLSSFIDADFYSVNGSAVSEKDIQFIKEYIKNLGFEEPSSDQSFYNLLKRQFVEYKKLQKFATLPFLSDTEINCLEIEAKYEGYIKMAYEQAFKLKQMEDYKIPSDIDYKQITGISLEAREMLSKIKPSTIGLASRVISVHPADIDTLLFYIKHKQKNK